jgi:hypothetical protein
VVFSGCGTEITFTKVDLRGHVRVVGPQQGQGYCFRVPSDWEIREDLEGADVVCLSPPVKGKFRESVVARSVSAQELKDPQALILSEMEKMGEQAKIVEPWDGKSQKPMLVQLNDKRFSALPLSQLLFFHLRPEGDGVLICCTTVEADMPGRRAELEGIVAKAEFDLSKCSGPAGIPETFPTPEVTYSPAAPAVVPATQAPASPAAVRATPASVSPATSASPSVAAPAVSATP